MIEILKLFFKAEKTKPWLVLPCLVVASLLEAFGVSSILPIANILTKDGSAAASKNGGVLERFIERVLEVFSLQPSIGNLLLLLFLAMLLRAIIMFATMSYTGLTAARVVTTIRRNLIKAVFDARWSYYSSQKSGVFASVLSGDAPRAGQAYSAAAFTTSLMLQVLGYSMVALVMNWKASIAGLAVAVLIGISSRWLISLSKQAGIRLVNRTATVTEDTLDLMRNIKGLKAMHSYEPPIHKINEQVNRIKKSIIKIQVSGYGLSYLNDALVVAFVCSAVYVANQIAGLSLPELTVLGIVFFQVVNLSSKVQKNMQGTLALSGSYEHARQITDEARSYAEGNGGSLPAKLDAAVIFDRVSFNYGDREVLKEANLEIPLKRITVLTGPSGSGKTTLIDLLTVLNVPTSGTIRTGEVPLSSFNLRSWRKKIGYVAQDLVLFHDTVRANLVLGNQHISEDEVITALKQANAWEFVSALPQGLDTDVGEHGSKLSGGQRQRIALARALIGKPELLILDEVTSALDPDSEAEIIRNIAGLGRQYTIVSITHRPAWKEIADKLYYVNEGRVTPA